MYHIIVNPASRSGRGLKIWKQIEPLLLKKKVSYQVYFSKKPGDVEAEALRLSGLHTPVKLILLGGDGTLNEALQGLHPLSSFIIGYIPTGSSNDLARDLHLPTEPAAALDVILKEEHITPMDVGVVEYENTGYHPRKRKFIVSCGIGYDAAVCQEALHSPIKDTLNHLGLGKLTYLGIALKQLITTPKSACELWLDDAADPVKLSKILFIATMNHRYEGGGFKFCPDADYTDGAFDLCVAGNIPKAFVLPILPTAFSGKHFRFKGITPYRAKKIRIRTALPLWVHTDGEVKTKADSILLYQNEEKLSIIS